MTNYYFYYVLKKLILGVLLFWGFFFFFPYKTFAEETGYRFPTTCTTNGSSCENMRYHDTLYNSWYYTYFEYVDATFTDFGIPDEAILDDILIKLRIRTNTPFHAWHVRFTPNGGISYVSPFNCLFIADPCKYQTTEKFNSIASYTYKWYNNQPKYPVTGTLINSPEFALRIWQSTDYKITDIDIVLFNVRYHMPPPPTPTPTPQFTPAPTLTPTPKPFLDLPWDYKEKGLTFTEAALSINAFFDHEYPLLSSGYSEPIDKQGTTINYLGGNRSIDIDYSNHDGYDYGRIAKVYINDPVLAAADGTAQYISTCSACGNMIVIDHGNGYQTRYLHLHNDGLISTNPNEKIPVTKGQAIGKVGATGNVVPPNDNGAHIHFGVFQDKDNNGNFNDNIPDGVTDPYGWQSKDPDPWRNYTFLINGQTKKGNASYYLWEYPIDDLTTTLTSSPTTLQQGSYSFTFPTGSTLQNLLITFTPSPIAHASPTISSLGTTMQATATDFFGNPIFQFINPFLLSIDFSSLNLSRFNPNSLTIYSSADGQNWVPHDTAIDFTTQKATASIDHFSYFALMAERKDTTPPTTTPYFEGQKGKNIWFLSPVILSLNAQDNENGLGVDYTMTKLPDTEWDIYSTPFSFNEDGTYDIEYYSADNDENIEERKTIHFGIDTIRPEIEMGFDPTTLSIESTGKDMDIDVPTSTTALPENKEIIYTEDTAGNSLSLIVKEKQKGKDAKIKIESLSYNNENPRVIPASLAIKYFLEKGDILKKFEQVFMIEDTMKLKLDYSPIDNTTKIIMWENTQEKVVTSIPGMKLLKIFTKEGTLNYKIQ